MIGCPCLAQESELGQSRHPLRLRSQSRRRRLLHHLLQLSRQLMLLLPLLPLLPRGLRCRCCCRSQAAAARAGREQCSRQQRVPGAHAQRPGSQAGQAAPRDSPGPIRTRQSQGCSCNRRRRSCCGCEGADVASAARGPDYLPSRLRAADGPAIDPGGGRAARAGAEAAAAAAAQQGQGQEQGQVSNSGGGAQGRRRAVRAARRAAQAHAGGRCQACCRRCETACDPRGTRSGVFPS